MKLAMPFVLLALLLSVGRGHADMWEDLGDITTEVQERAYLNLVWDWTSMSDGDFLDYQGNPLPSPWTSTDFQTGLHVPPAKVPRPIDGWRLYKKRLLCEDYKSKDYCEITSGSDRLDKVASFHLYNVYTGTLRSLLYIPIEPHIDKYFRITVNLVRGGARSDGYAILANEGANAYALDHHNTTRLSSGHQTIVPALEGHWAIIDHDIAYDPRSSIEENLRLQFELEGIREETITTRGSASEAGDGSSGKVSRSDFAQIGEIVGAFGSAFAAIKSSFNSLSGFQDSIKKREENIKNRRIEDQGKHSSPGKMERVFNELHRLSSIPLFDVGAFGYGVFGAIDVFKRTFFDSHSVAYTPQVFQINLESLGRGERTIDVVSVGLLGSPQTDEPKVAAEFFGIGRLGVVSIRTTPRFAVGDDFATYLNPPVPAPTGHDQPALSHAQEARSRLLVHVNPDSGMRLAKVEIWPAFRLPDTFQDCTCEHVKRATTIAFGRDSVDCGRIGWRDDSGVLNGEPYTRSTEGPYFVTSNEPVSPFDMPEIRWDPRRGCYVNERPIKDNSTFEEGYLKVYVHLVHKRRSDVFFEQVLTVPVEFEASPCAKRWWPLNGGDFGTTCSLLALARDEASCSIALQGAYTVRPCGLRVGQARVFSHRNFSAVSRSCPQLVGCSYLATQQTLTFNTHNVGNIEDRASSIMVGPATRVKLYEDKNRRGKMRVVSNNVSNFDEIGLNDEVSSARLTWDNLRGHVSVSLAEQNRFATRQKWNEYFCIERQHCAVGDVNGDGRDDVIAFVHGSPSSKAAGVWVSLSDGSSFTMPNAQWIGRFCLEGEVCAVGDVNGDGRADLVAFVHGAAPGDEADDVWVALSDGSRFNIPERWSGRYCLKGEVCAVGDVNGDGAADLIAFVHGSQSGPGGDDVWVSLSNGTGFDAPRKWSDRHCLQGEVCAVGDVNNDGRGDLIAFVHGAKPGAEGDDVWVSLSDGARFGYPQRWSDRHCLAGEICAVGDVNGDGFADLIAFVHQSRFSMESDDVWVSLSQGSRFGAPQRWREPGYFRGEIYAVGDVNGDERADLVEFRRSFLPPS